jgi:hypothetical protein
MFDLVEALVYWDARQRVSDRPLCEHATAELAAQFPELTRTRGHVYFETGTNTYGHPMDPTKPWPHWWLVDSESTVLDPTACQFHAMTSGASLRYEPLDEALLEQHGPPQRCMNCGALAWGSVVCSEACERELRQDMGLRDRRTP